jgi:hypothetical protein
MAEALALALPDYPRAPDAEMETGQFAAPGVDPMTDEDAKPLAGLAALRARMDGENGRWRLRGLRPAPFAGPSNEAGKGLAWPRNRSMFPASLALGPMVRVSRGSGRMVRGADECLRRTGARRCETTRLTFATARIGAGGQNFEVVTWLSPRTE